MKWPKGKWNGRRIGGCRVSFAINLCWWFWKPRIEWRYGLYHIVWLCVAIRAYPEYE